MWPDHNLTTAELFIHLYILPRGEVVMSTVRTSLTCVYNSGTASRRLQIKW